MANWVHVACSWFHDIAPARELDLKRIWIDRDHTGQEVAEGTIRLENLDELVRTVRAAHGSKPSPWALV